MDDARWVTAAAIPMMIIAGLVAYAIVIAILDSYDG